MNKPAPAELFREHSFIYRGCKVQIHNNAWAYWILDAGPFVGVSLIDILNPEGEPDGSGYKNLQDVLCAVDATH